MNILELHQVSKKYGSKYVLNKLDLHVPKGSIFGFVGENGAGKTTTMRMILGLEEKSSGEILIKGTPVTFGDNETNRYTGYLPDVPEFYDYMSGKEYLTFCGQLTGMKKEQLLTKVSELLSLVGLKEDKKKIKGYSRGMKQRLGIAQALLNDPELLICDEPTSALDPGGRNDFLEMLATLKGHTTIVFSTHILNDVERICDHVGILDQGQLVLSGPLAELKQQYAKKQIEIEFKQNIELQDFTEKLDRLKIQQQLKGYSFNPQKNQYLLEYIQPYEKIAPLLFKQFEDAQVFPKKIKKIDPSLETIFLEVIK